MFKISPAGGPSTYQIIHIETLDFHFQHQQWYHKMPGWKINFCGKLAVKTLLCYVAYADIGSVKSLNTII